MTVPADDTPQPRVPTLTGGTGLGVVTLNLYHDAADWPLREPLIVSELRALRPDVIALQEVLQHEGLPNQAGTLAQALGYEWRFFSTDPPGQARRYGNALLTRRPIIDHSERRLRPDEDNRIAGHLRIELDGYPVAVYVTHLHWKPEGGAIRRRQVQDLLAFIHDTRHGAAVVIAGDFNAEPDAPELSALHRAGYADAYGQRHPQVLAGSVTTVNPAFFDFRARIDHIFYATQALRADSAEIVLNQADAAGTSPSDHFGLYARLTWQRRDR